MIKEFTTEDIKGIEFFEDEMKLMEDVHPPEAIKFLAGMFHKELNENGVNFKFNEDDESHIPLRKYYASALKIAYQYLDPTKVKKWNDCKNIGHGFETLYYHEVLLKKTTDEVYDMFFIVPSNDLLYSITGRDDSYSVTTVMGTISPYGYINFNERFNEALDPDYGKNSIVNKVFAEMEKDENYRLKWNDIYEERLSVLYSYHTKQLTNKLQREEKPPKMFIESVMDMES